MICNINSNFNKMASIKVKFRPSAVADREGAVYYQVIHERKVRILPTSYRIFDSEWDNEHSTLSRTDKNAGRTDHLLTIVLRSDLTSNVWPQYAGNSTSIVCVSLPTILWLNSTA